MNGGCDWGFFGDKNPERFGYRQVIETRNFFHASTINSRRKNPLAALRHDNGIWLESRSEIRHFFIENFTELYHVEPKNFFIVWIVSFREE